MTREPLPRENLPRESLPIDELLPQIVDQLRSAGALVLTAEPGAGKTTRVPPAMLDAGLATSGNGKPGKIVVLQPRRVAARAAALRIAGERGGEVGGEIGYQVRFEKKAGRDTRILICTEGIFLRRLQDDPLLEDTAAVVFDEFHERSVDSDLALAMVRQVRKEVRPDLRILVMSATLDSGPVASYLDGCPTLTCPGRTYPIDIEYLRSSSGEPSEEAVADGVRQMLQRTDGHVLVFLPGVGEIRQATSVLAPDAAAGNVLVTPLYGEMPLDEQQRVLAPSKQRKIVLATNVAETSLTVDGVSAVVDTGLARINRLDPRLGLNRLDVTRISKASADQRAGRAGRTAAGRCLRLWTEREHHMLRDFELPEIARVDLSRILMQLIAWGESDVRAFPWFEAPPAPAIDQALMLLERLDALSGGRLTDSGRRMARLPLQPRTARLLVEGQRLGQAKRAALCAALLEERDPFRRVGTRTTAKHHSDSDVLDRLDALEEFADRGTIHSAAGELLPGPAKQVLRASDQLERVLAESRSAFAGSGAAPPGGSAKSGLESCNKDEAILRAILTAYPDRVCRRRGDKGGRALMVGGRGVRLADESAVAACELFVAVELHESGQSESLVRQASLVEKDWLPAAHVREVVDAGYDTAREKVTAVRRRRFFDLVIDEVVTALPPDADASAALAEAAATNFDLETLVNDDARRYMARIRCLREWLPELELPDFGADPWRELLPEWCAGCASIAEMRAAPLVAVIQSRLLPKQIAEIERCAPDGIVVPSGRRIRLEYEPGKPPVLAVRIQEMFGLPETPRIANSRVAVLLHLLGPNFRVQQITPDLASFWANAYPEVKKELKRRYPKHAWPDDPLTATAESKPQRRR